MGMTRHIPPSDKESNTVNDELEKFIEQVEYDLYVAQHNLNALKKLRK